MLQGGGGHGGAPCRRGVGPRLGGLPRFRAPGRTLESRCRENPAPPRRRTCHDYAVTRTDPRGLRGLPPLLLVSLVVVLWPSGSPEGSGSPNLHNALLALSLTMVGAYVLFQRPGHREGLLFMAAGVVEAIMFLGRQVGHIAVTRGRTRGGAGWACGRWPIALALTTFAVICFPDGRLPSPRWRPVAVGGRGDRARLRHPVGDLARGVRLRRSGHHPSAARHRTRRCRALWTAIAHPAYFGFQVLWVVALVARWRSSRRQRTPPAGLAGRGRGRLRGGPHRGAGVWGTPVPGLIAATLLPVTAGWAIVHGQNVTAYSALTWLSRTRAESRTCPRTSHGPWPRHWLRRERRLWMGPADDLHAVGVWPETGEDIPPTDLDLLRDRHGTQIRAVTDHETVVGALSDRPAPGEPPLARGGQALRRPRRAGALGDRPPRPRRGHRPPDDAPAISRGSAHASETFSS